MRRTLVLVGLSLLPGTIGCAQTWDDLTSRRFREAPFKTLFTSEDPMTVLQGDYDTDMKIRAMQALKEPATRGGSAEQQEAVIQILSKAATTDSYALVRLTAIETLTRFEDNRVPGILVSAYHNAGPGSTKPPAGTTPTPNPISTASLTLAGAEAGVGIQTGPFNADVTATIRAKVLEGIGQKQSPEGLALLMEVANYKPPVKAAIAKDKDTAQLTSRVAAGDEENNEVIVAQMNKQSQIDVRMAAVRALGQYKNNPQAVQTLTVVMQKEKDIALRDRAQAGLKEITGKDVPLEPESATAPAALPKLEANPGQSPPVAPTIQQAMSPEIMPTEKPTLFKKVGRLFGGGEEK